MKAVRHQSGVALAVTLFMLGLLTVIGVSAVMLGTTHLRLVSNLQAEKEAEMALQQWVECYISSPGQPIATGCPPNNIDPLAPPSDPPPESVTVNGRALVIDISKPRCTGYIETRSGPETYPLLWEFTATATDTATGVSLRYHWGITAPMAIRQCCDDESPIIERHCH